MYSVSYVDFGHERDANLSHNFPLLLQMQIKKVRSFA